MRCLFAKPVIILSRCFGFERCRYDNEVIRSHAVEQLLPFINPVPVCPETAIGLGTPRERIRIVSCRERVKLVQPATGRDLTRSIENFCHEFLEGIVDVDGFILKSRSPTCGIKDAKIYPSAYATTLSGYGSGFFAAKVARQFPLLPMLSERDLALMNRCEHFLIRIFACAALRMNMKNIRVDTLIKFHTKYKLLIAAYSKKILNELENILKRYINTSGGQYPAIYQRKFQMAFSRASRRQAHMKILGESYKLFANQLSVNERRIFVGMLERFESGVVSLGSCVKLMRRFAAEFDREYFLRQAYFNPYPEALVPILDRLETRTTCP